MGLQDYIEKQRARPEHERKRLAVIWTAIGFAAIFLIWIVSFKEMNKPTEQPVDQTSASLNDLKDNFQTGKDSIQDMVQDLPAPPDRGEAGGPSQTKSLEEAGGADSFAPAPDDNSENNQDNNSVPQLP